MNGKERRAILQANINLVNAISNIEHDTDSHDWLMGKTRSISDYLKNDAMRQLRHKADVE